MNKSEITNHKSQIFLGVDGGQSHTEAVVADAEGRIFGRGTGGPSNHAEQPGGRERLRRAVVSAVCEALKISESRLKEQRFRAAHCGMTGGADYKEEIIGELLNAEILTVGHDAPTALAAVTGGRAGIVVISGTGSVVYGEDENGARARAGGLGFLFSDEGSAFWLAAQTIRLAVKEQDGVIANAGLENTVCDYFKVSRIRDLTTAFYNEKISRDELAGFAKFVQESAEKGNKTLEKLIADGAQVLAENVKAVAGRLNFTKSFPVGVVGGMFRGALMRSFFVENLRREVPHGQFTEPRFSPATGALLLAYRSAKIELSEQLLENLVNSKI